MSALSIRSKLFGNFINNHVQSFCRISYSLAKIQFGFRKNRNTDLVVLYIMDKLLPVFDDKKKINTICVFLITLFLPTCHNICAMTELNHLSNGKNLALSKTEKQALYFLVYSLLILHVCVLLTKLYCTRRILYWCM